MKNVWKTMARITTQHRIALFGLALLALATVIPTAVNAQTNQQFSLGGLQGVHRNQGRVLPPPSPKITNCATGCTNYNVGAGYYVSGTASINGTEQTLAVSFTPSVNGTLTRVIAPNSCWTAGCNTRVMTKILADCAGVPCPGVPLRALTQVTPVVPTWPATAPITYAMLPLPVTAGTKYWVCQRIWVLSPTRTALWMLSDSDTSPDFAFNLAGSCTVPSTSWNNVSGSVRPAFEVR
jgi:hypothetical protein